LKRLKGGFTFGVLCLVFQTTKGNKTLGQNGNAMKYLLLLIILVCFSSYIVNAPDSHPIYKGMKKIAGWIVE
jgi:hypothetical protein